MRRVRVATIAEPSDDDGEIEGVLLLLLVICGIAFAAFMLGAQLEATLRAVI